MSKYNDLIPQIQLLSKQNPDLGSDKIAELVAQTHSDISPSSLGRYIRAEKLLHTEGNIQKTPSKVWLFDTEVAPMRVYAWSLWQDSINPTDIITNSFMLCWSAKELFSGKVINMTCTPDEARHCDDERITRGLWKLFDEADVLIAHNLKKYDRKVANTRFIHHKLPVPGHYSEIDTLIHAKRNMKFPSNRLDALATFLGHPGKMDTPKGLWAKAMNGDKTSLKTMVDYCDQDVRVLEDVYLDLRPWITPHPNLTFDIIGDEGVCAKCGSEDLNWDITPFRTQLHEYHGYRCNHCGTTGKGRNAITSPKVKERMTIGA